MLYVFNMKIAYAQCKQMKWDNAMRIRRLHLALNVCLKFKCVVYISDVTRTKTKAHIFIFQPCDN